MQRQTRRDGRNQHNVLALHKAQSVPYDDNGLQLEHGISAPPFLEEACEAALEAIRLQEIEGMRKISESNVQRRRASLLHNVQKPHTLERSIEAVFNRREHRSKDTDATYELQQPEGFVMASRFASCHELTTTQRYLDEQHFRKESHVVRNAALTSRFCELPKDYDGHLQEQTMDMDDLQSHAIKEVYH